MVEPSGRRGSFSTQKLADLFLTFWGEILGGAANFGEGIYRFG